MADIGGSHNEAFTAGLDHLANPGRANLGSITLGGALQDASDRQAAPEPAPAGRRRPVRLRAE